ncbi:neuronal cell adhesion molecule-like [Glandiceps talaboti]
MVQRSWWLRICLLSTLSILILAQDDEPHLAPPSITKQPQTNIVVDEREQEYPLECEATGNPAPTYVWKKDGTVLSTDRDYEVDGRIIKLLVASDRNHRGIYQCFARNSFGTALSSKIDLRVSFLDRFALDSAGAFNFRVQQGAKLPCLPPPGVPEPRVFWSKKLPESLQLSERVAEDPLGNLIFSNVVAKDSAQYFCNVIQDGYGEIKQSPVFNVTVATTLPAAERKPTMLYSPIPDGNGNVIVLRNEDMRLKCLAEGFPTPSIAWEKTQGEEIPQDRHSSRSFGQTLEITDVEYSDEGKYRCTATNSGGTDTKEVTVKVEAKPYWEEQPEDYTIPPESDITIECKPGGIPTPTVTWLQNGEEITETADRRTIMGNKISFTNAQVSDTSVYQCVASNKHGEIMQSMFLNVQAVPAKIVVPPPEQTQTVVDGTAKITCETFGSPTPVVTWKFKGQAVSGDRYEIWKNGTLVITGITVGDAGTYSCDVQNSFGQEEAEGKLIVLRKTTIDIPPTDKFTTEGTDVNFECSATADTELELQVYWEKNGERLGTRPTSRYRVDPATSTLTIRRPQMLDTNEYTCVAATALDEARATAELTVQNVPKAPTNVRVEDTDDDLNVNLHWSEPDSNNSPITEYIVQYTTEFDNYEEWKEQTKVGAVTTAALELSPWVVYKFRVVAVNGIGTSEPSDIVGTLTTDPAPPTLNPTNFKGTPDTPYHMVISWDAMEPETHNGPNFNYILKWRKAGDEDWTPEMIGDWETTSFRVDTDKPWTMFEMTIQTSNMQGTGPDPVEAVGFSGESAPVGKPANVVLTVNGPTEIMVDWNEPPQDTVNGEITGYKILYTSVSLAKQQRQKRAVETKELVVNTAPAILSDLTPYSTYTIEVQAKNSAGDGPSSDPVNADTPEGVPGIVADYELIALSNGFYLRWDFPENPNGVITGYEITCEKMLGTELGHILTYNITDAYIFKKKIGDLKPLTQYLVKIRAHTKVGGGEYIRREETTRELAPPRSPSQPELVQVGDSSMNVTWTTDEEGPSVNHYVVRHKKKGTSENDWTSSEEIDPLDRMWHVLSDLDSGTWYDIQVAAFNMKGTAQSPLATEQTSGAGALEASDSVVKKGWFIGLMCVIVFLLIILLIICLIKRNKGGKYHVSEKEDQLHGDIESDPHKDDGDGFREYKGKDSPDETEPLKKPDNASHRSSKVGSDTDSMAEYGDGGDTGQFNEDGSFIGQYGDEKKRKQQDQAADGDASSPAAFSTFV